MYKYKDKVEEIFGSSIVYYGESGTNVYIEISGGFNAEKLFKLSDVLDTGVIHVTPTYSGGGCDTCDYGAAEVGMELRADGVKL